MKQYNQLKRGNTNNNATNRKMIACKVKITDLNTQIKNNDLPQLEYILAKNEKNWRNKKKKQQLLAQQRRAFEISKELVQQLVAKDASYNVGGGNGR